MGSELYTKETIVKIKVLGAGGGGSNAVNRMIEDDIQNVDFIIVDTNAISASKSKARHIIQIGENEAQGIGAGANPDVGEKSAKENLDEIHSKIKNTDLLFLTAGMGGGTGTGALPVIAEMAKEMEILTIGIETVNWNGEDPEWALNRICEIIKEMEVKAIVLGSPARTDGKRSETQDKAEAFGKELASRCGIEPVYKDERFTTVLASRYLHESNVKAKQQKKVIDQVAAEIILQDYLNML